MKTKVLAIISQKGGAGKTTLATHLAVAAENFGLSTAIFDLDPQASATVWADRRGEAYPAVVPAQAPRLAALIDKARQQGADLVILDTPPAAMGGTAPEACRLADAVLIPCRPSGIDLAAIADSVQIARAAGKPFWVVASAAPIQGGEVDELRTTLAAHNVPVCPVVLHQRKAFAARMHEGRTASEIEPTGKAAVELRDLFLWVCENVMLLPSDEVIKLTSQLA